MKQNEKDLMVKAINKFMFWTWNYESIKSPIDGEYYPDAIVKVDWTCDSSHIYDKWLRCCRRANHDTTLAMSLFYGDLDGNNRIRLLEWVIENYNSEPEIKKSQKQ